ncbi:MAG TPA: hypothetical protein VG328_18755 [Stellaceae bacterium]|jgi:hypothetical protein|nr:hypothetical protein [Stellaceae bacterium]
MTVPSSLAVGDHVVLADPAVHWETTVSHAHPPRVVLTASMQVGEHPPLPGHAGVAAATVAIQMDSQTALQLYGKLYALVRSMGWLPEE